MKAHFKPFSIYFNLRDFKCPRGRTFASPRTPACYHGKGVRFHSEPPCPAARRAPRPIPAPSPLRLGLRPAAGPGPRQELSRTRRTPSTEPRALGRRGSWTHRPAFGPEQSGRPHPGDPSSPWETARGRSLGLVTWLGDLARGRLEDASSSRPPTAGRREQQVSLSCSQRREAAEGLCAGPGIPAPRRLWAHGERAPALPGVGGRPGPGEEGRAERSARRGAPGSAIRPPAQGPGSLHPYLAPGDGGGRVAGVGRRRQRAEPDLRALAPTRPCWKDHSFPPILFVFARGERACVCLRALRYFRTRLHFQSPKPEGARRCGPGWGWGGPGGGAVRVPAGAHVGDSGVQGRRGASGEPGAGDGGGVGKEGCGEEP